MIHNHEVPGSIPGLATETEKVEKLSPFFVFYFRPAWTKRGSPAKVM